jgi:hypothetical protein
MTTRQQSILIGAVVTGVLSTSYLSFINVVCCLGVILGSMVAVQQYTSRSGTAIEAGDGAVLGALTGVAGAILGSIFDQILRPLGLDSTTISQDAMQQWMQGMQGQQGMSPEMMEQFQGGGGGMTAFIISLVFGVVIYAIFGAIGGAIGAAIFGSDEGGGGQPVQTPEAEVVE